MKWIKCEKRMPAKHQTVLVFVIDIKGEYDIDLSWIDDDGWAMGSQKGFSIDYWMPLPKPPEETP